MKTINEIQYELVTQDNFITALEHYPEGAVAFDYETYNDVDNSLAIEPWDKNTHPFMFSLCLLEDMDNHIKVFLCRNLSSQQKEVFRTFLKSREVWAFNSKFEGGVTWKLLNEFIKFDDVQVLYKTDGRFVNNLSLKKGTVELLGAPNWAESAWETRLVLEQIVERVSVWMRGKRKPNEMVSLLMDGNLKGLLQYISDLAQTDKKVTQKDIDFFRLVRRTSDILTPQLILRALIISDFHSERINLKYVPIPISARYCAYDAYATAMNYHHLWETCREQYPIYLKQSHLSCIMETYSATRDLDKESELESAFKEEALSYIKKLYTVPRFVEMFELQLEDLAEIETSDNEEELRKKYWNYNASGGSAKGMAQVKRFYDLMFSSPLLTDAVRMYNIYRFATTLEGFTEKDTEGNDVSILKRMKWNTMSETVPLVIANVKTNRDRVERELREFLGETEFQKYYAELYSKTEYLYIGENSDKFQELSQAFIKWEPMPRKLQKTIKESKTPRQIQMKDNKGYRDLDTSLSEDHIGLLFSALETCADMSADVPFEEMPWEMQIIFCCKVLKKIDKMLGGYITGRQGRECLRGAQSVEDVMEVPIRDANIDNYWLYQLRYAENAADTKRWRAAAHTIPPNSDIPDTFIPRSPDNVFVYWDLSQAEVRVVAALAQEDNLLNVFRNDPKADIHMMNACLVFGKTPDKITKQERSICKGVTFLTLYGGGVEALAEGYCDGNLSQAKEILNKFYTAFPKLKGWIDEQHRQVRSKGYVCTLFGDKIWIPQIGRNQNDMLRKAQNYPVQSTSSSLTGLAIWAMWEECQRQRLKAFPQWFVHDSTTWDVEARRFIDFAHIVNTRAIGMINDDFGIPMRIDFEIGVSKKKLMGISNLEIAEDLKSCKFEFECTEKSFPLITDRLGKFFTLESEIKGEKEVIDSWSTMFKPKGVFTLDKNKPVKHLEGEITLKSA